MKLAELRACREKLCGFLDRKVEASLKLDVSGTGEPPELHRFLDRKVEASLKLMQLGQMAASGRDSSTERSRPH